MTTTADTVQHDRHLRYIADAYEQAQRVRIQNGERIRAVLQGKDETWATPEEWEGAEPDTVLNDIAAGVTLGPVPVIGRTYRRFQAEENDLRKDMLAALRQHPVWLGWLKDVRGIGPTLGCKILATFDMDKTEGPEKVSSPSAYWRFAGLATVPGVRYACSTCGLTRAYPPTYDVKPGHTALGGTTRCKGELVAVAGPEDGVRVAEPHSSAGQRAVYSMRAKKLMYLVGTSFLKASGPYEAFYRKHRARLEVDRPGWQDGRKHYTALRIVEKLFLSHLWEVERKLRGLEVRKSYAEQHLGHDGYLSPWDFTGKD